MQIIHLTTPEQIAKSFIAFKELRPSLESLESFLSKVLKQQKEGYQIVAIDNCGEIVACAGFRFINTLAWGNILYIDDLVTLKKFQNKGYARALLDHIKKIAHDNECDQIHLDSGYARHAAHKLYLSYGFEIQCHHLALNMK